MIKSRFSVYALGLAVTAAAMFVSPLAHSQNAVLQLQNGATTITIGDNSANDSNSNVGVVTYVGPCGDFSTNVTTGTSKPVVGSATSPELNLASLDITNTTNSTETLTLSFSDNNFGPVTGTPQASLSITQLSQTPQGPPNGSVTYDSYFSPSNTTLAHTTLLTAIGPVTVSGTNVGSLGTFAYPFSLTQVLTITLNAGGTFLGSAALNVTAIPEVNGVWTGAAAALLLGVSFARRRSIRSLFRRALG